MSDIVKITKKSTGTHGEVWGYHSDPEKDDDITRWVIEELDGSLRKEARKAISALHTVVSQCDGPKGLGKKLCHPMSNKDGIDMSGFHEVTTAKLRVLFFMDENKLLIASHGFIKKGDDTPVSDQMRALECREKYFAAKKAGKLMKKGESDDEQKS